VSLADYYRRQHAWRSWSEILDALPPVRGKTVLDLGCGVGDQAAELVARGARVVGFEMNDEVLEAARSRGLEDAEFHRGDLRALPDLGFAADGIWCSFAAAYFIDLPAVLVPWSRNLAPGGWIALTEIDDFFGHEPVGPRTRELLAGYAHEALAAGRYDFHMGRKLRDHLAHAGFESKTELTVGDQELSFEGPARPDVLEAWRVRLEGMKLLHDFCGSEFGLVRDEFLGCLARPDHRSLAKVVCCIATRCELVKLLERANALRQGPPSPELSAIEEQLQREYCAAHRLAVYGSLAPGEKNHDLVRDPEGRWEPGTVRGEMHEQGWGATLGFPGLRWKPDGGEIAVQLLTSALLPQRWLRLDRFEGPEYRRSLVPVATASGIVVANIYEVR
jgi:SAM-dependent methyltransferase/gamma-glutamylcyclotransferase (GGCT)/AIG2-like uncharacterized protein YtfP